MDEARRWIGFNTVTTRSNARFAAHVSRRFASLGFDVRRQRKVVRGAAFENVLARRGRSGQKPLLFNTHLDTVPAGPARFWTSTGGNAWRATKRGGFLYGLGTADVKLNLLCQWEALRQIGPRSFARPLCVVGTFGEEHGLQGVQHLWGSWRGPKPIAALVGEPSEGRLVRRHRSYLVFEWRLPFRALARNAGWRAYSATLAGKSAHSSTPGLGRNALQMALDFLARLDAEGLEPQLLSLRGGTAQNQVPAEAVLVFALPQNRKPPSHCRPARAPSLRCLPWPAVLDALSRIARLFPSHSYSSNLGLAETDGSGLRLTLDLRSPPEKTTSAMALRLRAALKAASSGQGFPLRARTVLDNPGLQGRGTFPVKNIVEKALRASGHGVAWREKLTCTEAGVYDRHGVPAVVWGPGVSRGNVHKPNERVALNDLHRAVRFYKKVVEQWCLNE